MAKKLNASAVNSAAKKAYTMKTFHLEDNQCEIWDVDIDVKMNPDRVVDMAADLIRLSAKIHAENIESFDYERHVPMLYFIETLKHYTSVTIKDKETAEETLADYAVLTNSLSSLGLVDKILECFDKDSLNTNSAKFTEAVQKMSDFVAEEAKAAIEQEAEEVAE